MNIVRIGCAVLIIVVSLSSVKQPTLYADGTTYYGDCAQADQEHGTEDSPWNSLDPINAHTFAPGDQLVFKHGTTCTGRLWPKGSGADGAPITIGAYGSGSLPIIDGQDNGSKDRLIEHSIAYDTGQQPSPETIGTPWIWTCRNCPVQFSEAYRFASPHVDGGCIDIDWGAKNNLYQYNYGHDSDGYCQSILGAAGLTTVNAIVRYNVCQNNARRHELALRLGDLFISTWEGGKLSGVGENELTIGFLPVRGESEWYTALDEDVREEVIQRGFRLVYSDPCAQDCHLYAFRTLIEQRVDAILLVPVERTGWDEVLQKAQDAGIPVVIMDRFIEADESLYVTHVSLDFVHEGRLAAAWLAQATSGTCQIVELAGIEGSQVALERQSGFEDVIELFPDMVISASQRGDFTNSGGRTAMETILTTTDPDEICAVWAHNDAMALGAIEALKDAGLDPGGDILIVSIDGMTDMLAALVAGDANATVGPGYHFAGPAFDALAAYFAGETVPKWIPVRRGISTQDTVTE